MNCIKWNNGFARKLKQNSFVYTFLFKTECLFPLKKTSKNPVSFYIYKHVRSKLKVLNLFFHDFYIYRWFRFFFRTNKSAEILQCPLISHWKEISKIVTDILYFWISPVLSSNGNVTEKQALENCYKFQKNFRNKDSVTNKFQQLFTFWIFSVTLLIFYLFFLEVTFLLLIFINVFQSPLFPAEFPKKKSFRTKNSTFSHYSAYKFH